MPGQAMLTENQRIGAEIRARRLDGSPLTLTVREVWGIYSRLSNEISDFEQEAKFFNVLPAVIELIFRKEIFANLPLTLNVVSPQTLEYESIQVHEQWAVGSWKRKDDR